MAIDRRTFLKGSSAAAVAIAVGGPFEPYVARAQGAMLQGGGHHGRWIDQPELVPTPDLRDGISRLALPAGFKYRSFDPTGAAMADGIVPGNHDGMAAFHARRGKVLLIRNHERNGSTGAFASTAPTYDPAGPGGNTYVLVDRQGNVSKTWGALRGTQMNCAGGGMPWGSWITCEETLNGPDVFDDFTRNIPPNTAPNGEQTYIQNKALTKPHGYLFEVPTDRAANAEPITQAGRFAHEACAYSKRTGSLYLTEDNFGYGCGFYRYDPPRDPRHIGKVLDGGTLWMLALKHTPQGNLSGHQEIGTRYRVRWVQIPNPNPTFPMVEDPAAPGTMIPSVTNNQAVVAVGQQGWDGGAAVFSRLEGIKEHNGVIYFTSTQGGGDPEPVDWVSSAEARGGFGRGLGQVWAYYPKDEILECVYQSVSTDDLHLPDNVTVSDRGTLVICEDNTPPVPEDGNKLQALTKRGQLISIAQHLERPGVEWAGSTFSPDGQTLFVNLNTSSAMTVAIWGPWWKVGV